MRINVYYTGGGICVAVMTNWAGTRWMVDNDFGRCLSCFTPSSTGDEADFMPEDMLWSIDENEMSYKEEMVYNVLHGALAIYMNHYD